MNVTTTNDQNCGECNDPNPCTTSKLSTIYWDVVLSDCQKSLGITLNSTLSNAMNLITAAICSLQAAGTPAITCANMRITTDYANIGFSATETTTLCDLHAAINNKFGTVLDFNFDEGVFETSPATTTIPGMIQDIIDKLTIDLYTPATLLFLPLAGNVVSNLQQSIGMANNGSIYWYQASGYSNSPSAYGEASTGLNLYGGQKSSAGTPFMPIRFNTPTQKFYSERTDFAVLTAASTTLTENGMKPNYFVTKSSVTSIYLPQLSTMNIGSPIVTLTASVLDSATGAAFLYPALASGETIQLAAGADLTQVNTIVLLGDKAAGNWRIILMTTF